jgi:very-short-patch-repair endonuclease
MCDQPAKCDLVVTAIASRQHGVVSTKQLRAAGLDKHHVRHRARTGRLHRLHRGVYAVGHAALSSQARWMAAILACGQTQTGEVNDGLTGGDDGGTAVLEYWGSALSHRAAAALWGLLSPGGGPVDVSIRGYSGRAKRAGIRLHRSGSLLPAHVTLRDGIPVTTPARTIADLRRAVSKPGKPGLVSPRELRRAIRQANVLGLSIGEEADRDRTRSDLERDFLRLCDRHRLPVPEVNVQVGPHLVDFLWCEQGVIVETDGYRYHRGRAAFIDDRARDLDLLRRGFKVIRLSEEQVGDEGKDVAESLKGIVDRRSR